MARDYSEYIEDTWVPYYTGSLYAVLVSPGYGSGWSTWNSSIIENALRYDRRIVQAAIDKKSKEEVERIIRETFFLPNDFYLCMSGWDDVVVEYVYQDDECEIEVHDGYERLNLL